MHSRFSFIVALAVALSACSDTASLPSEPAHGAGAVTTVSPTVFIGRESSPSVPIQLEGAQWVSCAAGGEGEWVSTSGTINYRMQFVVDADGKEHGQIHANSQSLTGVGMSTGDVYRGNLISHQTVTEKADGGWTAQLNDLFQYVGTGKGTNFSLRLTAQAVFDADGNLTLSSEEIQVACR